jgi:chromosome transmission fidelity protein 18
VIDERIRPALESGSRINSSKPTLVIVDEIDGATGGGDNVSEEFASIRVTATDGV